MIEARLLTKVFPDRRKGAVRGADAVSFSVGPGQIYGLLGANGAGKTTTLRMIATLLRPTSGTATVAGHDVVAFPARVRASVGFLTAGTALYARLTARELIAYFGELCGLGRAEAQARIEVLARELDMHSFLDRRCESLSTGMRQKTSIARALVHDPQVMIFDEPTLGLDVMTARAVLRFVGECRARGKTVVYSTHVMAEAERLCDRVGIIDRGRILDQGSVPELLDRTGCRDLEDCFVRVVTGEPAP
jgi:sodium transport system ATP-binding protein